MEPEKQETCVSFEEFKKSLGTLADKYTDEQIKRMLFVIDGIADKFFNNWLDKTNAKAHNVKDDQAYEPINAK